MRTLIYGFFGEDSAQRVFLENYLHALNKTYKPQQLQFRASTQFNQQFQGDDKRGVDRGVRIAAEQGFGLSRFGLNCLFIGRDLDSDSADAYAHRLAVLQKEIPVSLHSRSLLMLPMQCIEHWVLYVKENKHDWLPLESLSNKAAQDMVYNGNLLASSRRKEIVQELTKDLRVKWLANRSPTFNLFHQQVENYLYKLP